MRSLCVALCFFEIATFQGVLHFARRSLAKKLRKFRFCTDPKDRHTDESNAHFETAASVGMSAGRKTLLSFLFRHIA